MNGGKIESSKNAFLYWKGYCSIDRLEGLQEVEGIISRYGFILDFQRFSDLEISLRIEVEERNLLPLYQQLCNCLLMDKVEDLTYESIRERNLLLNISFLKGTGDMNIDVPSVPG